MTGARVVVALLTLATVVAAAPSLPERLRSVAARYYAHATAIATITNRYSTMDYYERLIDDAGTLSDRNAQRSPASTQIIEAQSQLDLSLAQQLLSDTFIPLQSIRGAGETFVRSSKDGTMQPVAVYVPEHYTPDRPAPLVIFLHGRLQPESQLVAALFMQEIAEQNNTIVLAPNGRGYENFVGSESDLYDAYDAALKAFTTTPSRRYLVGYSMGAMAVFKIALMRPDAWSAIMSIAGAIPTNEQYSVVSAMHNLRFYVVTGERDQVVPTVNSIATATLLRNAGLSISFYSVPDGTHSLYTLRTAIAQAWTDMIRGAVRAPIGL
jgi:phospholipase/carboxylesterase